MIDLAGLYSGNDEGIRRNLAIAEHIFRADPFSYPSIRAFLVAFLAHDRLRTPESYTRLHKAFWRIPSGTRPEVVYDLYAQAKI